MPLPSEQHAFLSYIAYEPLARNDRVNSDRRQYEVLYISPPSSTDYRGAVFQDATTGQLIVANAGTNFANIHDVMADVSMGMMGASTQWPEAAATMRWAVEYAQDKNIPLSQISATGHSLGGAHAQLQATMFGVHAETFNAFGAERMARVLEMSAQAIHAAEGRVTNHRMYHDPVAPLADPIGATVVYMDRDDYQRHGRGDITMAVGEAAAIKNAHFMRNFWDAAHNRPAEVFAHNYLHDLRRSPLQERPPGMPLDTGMDRFPWGASTESRSGHLALQTPSRHASAEALFEHMHASLKTGDEGMFRQAITTAAHADINREFHASIVARVDAQEREAALQAQLQQAQEQSQAQQRTQARVRSM